MEGKTTVNLDSADSPPQVGGADSGHSEFEGKGSK